MASSLLPLLLLTTSAFGATTVPSFVAPAPAPTATSPSIYVGASNTTLNKTTTVPGKSFDRFIQIWLENTDFDDAVNSTQFQKYIKQGLLLDSYYAVTHPSVKPNYVASIGGDFFGMHDDNFYSIPNNISTIVDLLDAKNISWASYQENQPSDGFPGFNFTQPNYLNSSAPPYTYYVRKHNPLIVFSSVSSVPERAALIRNFNDFAVDVNAGAYPQWSFITPNLVNDGHDTDVGFISSWLEFWLDPLLADENFNDNRTLILLTFDENETGTVNNKISSILLGGALPAKLKGTNDSTYYTHYSILSTVQLNWGLGTLGRGDANKTMANVFSFVADAGGYKNENITGAAIPLTNFSGTYPGALNANIYIPFIAPNVSAVSPAGQPVFLAPGLNTSLTLANAPAPVNLTAKGEPLPGGVGTPGVGGAPPAATSASGAGAKPTTAGGGGTSGAVGIERTVASLGAVCVGMVMGLGMIL
ncbi:hypothetical protein BD410DRAFT_756958 [Rickenella mellea]|uniref:Phosphoesterase-domain-containing protein n=1 Tax=Rickenella mellea TaxID=50990 RepID=A0A4Y7PIB3_9AGAM|nr:hypothetical protein BD410DRAFT_756958 [Rickenella mellea]